MIPKLSVIVPIYNCEKYLRECLDSIEKQTLDNIQVLMIDDGSTDNSAKIAKEYAERLPGFEYYYKENGGTATARNLGLRHACGEYIGFVDSDDYIETNMYKIMYEFALDNNSDIVFAIMHGLGDYDNAEVGIYYFDRIVDDIFPNMIPHVVSSGTFRTLDWGNCSRLFKRQIISDHHILLYEGSRRCGDFAFCVECTLYAKTYTIIDEGQLYHYRPNEYSKSRSYTKNMWQSIRALMIYMKDLTEEYSGYDFCSAMDYCIFYFASNVLRNEMRNKNRKEIEGKISEVIGDSVCQNALNAISESGMNKEYKAIYAYMKSGDSRGMYRFLKSQNFKKKHIVPITNKLFKNKTVMKTYQKLRGK